VPGTRAPFRGWKVVRTGALIQGLQSAVLLQAFGAYAVVLEEEFGWSKSALSAAYSMNRAESALLGPVQGWMLDTYGPRKVARVGAVMMALGFVALSQIQSLWQFFLAFVFVSVGAGLSGFLTVTVSIVRWFERRRARALSFGSMGFALGGTAVSLIVFVINQVGWRWTAALTGVGSGIVIFVMARVLEGSPADFGQHVDGVEPGTFDDQPRAEGLAEIHFTAREAVRTRAFWMISLGHMSALFVVGAVLAHLALYLTNERHYSLQEASFFVSALPLVQLVGIGVGGWLGDRCNKRVIASLAMLGHASGLLLLAFANGTVMVWMFVVIHGLAWGARGPLMQALRADYFGSSSFGAIMGISSMIVMLGTTFGPLIAGVLADVTGSYRTGFVILAALAGLGMTFFVLATPPAPPLRAAESPGEH
jgi:MFS family permease